MRNAEFDGMGKLVFGKRGGLYEGEFKHGVQVRSPRSDRDVKVAVTDCRRLWSNRMDPQRIEAGRPKCSSAALAQSSYSKSNLKMIRFSFVVVVSAE